MLKPSYNQRQHHQFCQLQIQYRLTADMFELIVRGKLPPPFLLLLVHIKLEQTLILPKQAEAYQHYHPRLDPQDGPIPFRQFLCWVP